MKRGFLTGFYPQKQVLVHISAQREGKLSLDDLKNVAILKTYGTPNEVKGKGGLAMRYEVPKCVVFSNRSIWGQCADGSGAAVDGTCNAGPARVTYQCQDGQGAYNYCFSGRAAGNGETKDCEGGTSGSYCNNGNTRNAGCGAGDSPT